MPNRIIGGGICASDTLHTLRDHPDAEVLFYRLIVVADDFGRFDGRLAVIRSACYPLRTEASLTQRIGQLLCHLERATLISRYSVDGKPFLYIKKWEQHQRIRAVRAKYPDPIEDSNTISQQSAANCGDLPQPAADCGDSRLARAGTQSQSYSHAQSYSYSKADKNIAASPPGVRPEVWEGWIKHRGKKLTEHAIDLQRSKLEELARTGDDPNDVIEQSICNGWTGLFPVKRGMVNGHGPPRAPTLQERRAANMDKLTGKASRGERFGGTADRVDRPAIPSTASVLREPNDDDVGRR